MSEWRQFRILVRTSLGRLLDTAVASRGIDATQFAIWSLALVVTPPMIFAMRTSKYAFMWRQPDLLERTALADRLFFIVYVMLACALLAAVLWDALFPDRQDQEVVGVLPVRPRTLAAARLATALGVGIGLSAAIALLSGFVYMSNVAVGFRAASILGSAPAAFAGHVVAVTLAGVFTFAALLAVRGIAVACVGAEAAQRAATLLQLITVVLVLEALIFLPGMLNRLVREFAGGASTSVPLPPLWFMGLYAATAGPPMARVPGMTTSAIAATAAALLLAAVAYLAPATWNARRTLEAKLRNRFGRSVAIARRLASPLLPRPTARAVFAFTLASLLRSRRHALKLATYVAAAIALAEVRFTAAYIRDIGIPLDAPADYLLALPLVMTFFLVIGLHSAFLVPTDVEGNWIVRVAQPRSTDACVHALGVALVFVAVLPVTLIWFAITAWLWSWWEAAAAAAMHAASGIALVELTLIKCRSIPFTRAHAASVRSVRVGWFAGLFALHVFAFRLDDVQLAVLRSPRGVALYLLAMMLVVVLARVYRLSRPTDGLLEFEAPDMESPATLNLSQATG